MYKLWLVLLLSLGLSACMEVDPSTLVMMMQELCIAPFLF